MAELDDKIDEVVAVSDGGEADAADCEDGTVSPTPATVPKKRGRPSNSEKPKKATTTTSGRGRGRPAKTDKKSIKAAISADGSEEEETGSDGGSNKHNGDAVEAPTVVASKRGRKPKVKRKISHTVDITGKGRGRPKKLVKHDDAEDDDEGADDNDDGASSDYKPGKKAAAKSTKKGRGRPKKVQSDDDSSDGKQDDDEEKRPVGRPPSGGVNLNIVSTGRGLGRPKKEVAEKRAAEAAKRTADAENGGGQIKRQRGRPATSTRVAYSPTGKSRGRPKLAAQDKDSQDDEEEDMDVNTSSKIGENSADAGEENDKASSESEDVN